MTLWSPPRISKSALANTRAAFAPLANGLNRAARGAAARRAIRGLRAGRVSHGEIEQALAAGEGGLLALLGARAGLPELPTIPPRALEQLPSRTMLSAATIDSLLVWCRAFLAEGHVTVEEIHAVKEAESASGLLRLVVAAWNRMVDRVVDDMGLYVPDASRCAYTVAPATVLRAMDQMSGHGYGIDNLFDEGPHGDGVMVVTDGWPVVDLMADPATDPAFFAAVCEAWDALAVKTHLVVASGDTDNYLGGMLAERPGPGRRPLVMLAASLLGMCVVTHIVVFGAPRYALIWTPWLAWLLVLPRQSGRKGEPSPPREGESTLGARESFDSGTGGRG